MDKVEKWKINHLFVIKYDRMKESFHKKHLDGRSMRYFTTKDSEVKVSKILGRYENESSLRFTAKSDGESICCFVPLKEWRKVFEKLKNLNSRNFRRWSYIDGARCSIITMESSLVFEKDLPEFKIECKLYRILSNGVYKDFDYLQGDNVKDFSFKFKNENDQEIEVSVSNGYLLLTKTVDDKNIKCMIPVDEWWKAWQELKKITLENVPKHWFYIDHENGTVATFEITIEYKNDTHIITLNSDLKEATYDNTYINFKKLTEERSS